NVTENCPLFVALPNLSTMLTVALAVDAPSVAIGFGAKLQATPLAAAGVNTKLVLAPEMFALIAEPAAPVSALNVTVQPVVARFDAHANVTRPADVLLEPVARFAVTVIGFVPLWVGTSATPVRPFQGVRPTGHPEPAVVVCCQVAWTVTPWPALPVSR